MRPVFSVVAAAALGCAAAFAPARPPWPPLPDGHYMHVGDYLQVTGTGRAAKQTLSETQDRSEARDAALLDGWNLIKYYLESLPLESGGTAGQAAKNDPALAKKLERLAFAAEIVSTQWSGPTAVVILRLDKGAVNRALNTEFK